MSCNFTADFELARNVTYGNFETLREICPTTYIRPDPGGSMMPWLGSLLLLFFHLPACIIRAVKWESAQYLALGLASLGIALTVQAFVSTKRDASEVLVWMPLTLILDVGAMLQMVILIYEEHDKPYQEWRKAEPRTGKAPKRGGRVLRDAVKETRIDVRGFVMRKIFRRGAHVRGDVEHQNETREGEDSESQDAIELRPLRDRNNNPDNHSRQSSHSSLSASSSQSQRQAPGPAAAAGTGAGASAVTTTQPPKPNTGALHHAFIAFVSVIFLLMLLTLQGYGLWAAFKGRNAKDIRVNWCSPAFRDFAIAVTTGNCEKFDVLDSSSNGIGCISLPGDQQREWLLGAVIALICSLAGEFLDTVNMLMSEAHWKPRGSRFRRPWLTMFGGCALLIVLIDYGRRNANDLPNGVTQTVWIYRKEPSRELGRVCRGKLNPPGLRGVMIGYMDGLFESWGESYFGH